MLTATPRECTKHRLLTRHRLTNSEDIDALTREVTELVNRRVDPVAGERAICRHREVIARNVDATQEGQGGSEGDTSQGT